MADIATLEEFASLLQEDLDTATADLVLLDLAQGLVTEKIGARDPWPTIAKTTALNSAARAYVNAKGLRQRTVGSTTAIYNNPLYRNGVYLTEDEIDELLDWKGTEDGNLAAPVGCFPEPRDWPDPVERCW